ncbi:Isopentenyl-diphosphate Delta-isomerase [Candidatus Izimaplasma bacterium HR1]|jgi:8-oxo-dGTP pyrophosphatase MutT (NUDIX family)|uniref:NUDIX domain-containing protein n=1 Tax=Candidatus Izimoplasma sp. HR1 TaxID=1541959 RepID=UPI0004F921D3|nr:Isopentenyl-diphosphate Delta-isomerase [Candidatus Izimaplasma bacterium HR1]
MEIFDLYDENFNLLEHKMERGTSNEKGEYHLVVHIWIKTRDGKYLIQQRNKLTDRIPYQWAATGGAAVSGDDSIKTAIKETEEELGIRLKANQFELLTRYYCEDGIANFITDLYIVKEEILIKELKLDKVEVRDVAYKTMPEIKDMIKNNQFWNYERILSRKGYFDLLEKS